MWPWNITSGTKSTELASFTFKTSSKNYFHLSPNLSYTWEGPGWKWIAWLFQKKRNEWFNICPPEYVETRRLWKLYARTPDTQPSLQWDGKGHDNICALVSRHVLTGHSSDLLHVRCCPNFAIRACCSLLDFSMFQIKKLYMYISTFSRAVWLSPNIS